MERNEREYFRRVVSRGDNSGQYGEPQYEDVPIGELLSRLAAHHCLRRARQRERQLPAKHAMRRLRNFL